MKWSTIKKMLQLLATILATIAGTNIFQACINL